ncbi:hypothetical protein J6590_019463 [Homalodisca vitripennis]|nr:hypothetical protein J6590_019463 [Homalodisca vitripennis]
MMVRDNLRFYPDPDTRCQVFHVCSGQSGAISQQSFLCPNGTIFNKIVSTCDWWRKVRCVPDDPALKTISTPVTSSEEVPRVAVDPSVGRRPPKDRQIKSSYGRVRVNKISKPKYNSEIRRRNKVSLAKTIDQTKPPSTPRINSVSDEPSIKILNEYAESNVDTLFSSPVTEVSIKPRVKYTHSLKYSSESPIYSLNPIVQLARDSSLLATFESSASNENRQLSEGQDKINYKDKNLAPRFVIDGVLPQYDNLSPGEIPGTSDRLLKENTRKDSNRIDYGIKNDVSIPPVFSIKHENLNINDAQSVPAVNTNPTQSDVNLQKENGSPTAAASFDYSSSNAESNSQMRTKGTNYFVRVGSNLRTSLQNQQTEDNPPFVRVSSGYSFKPSTGNAYQNVSKQFRVTSSYSIEDQYQRVDSERIPGSINGSNNQINIPFVSKEIFTAPDADFAKPTLTTSLPEISEDTQNPEGAFYNAQQQNITFSDITPVQDTQFINRFEVNESDFTPQTQTFPTVVQPDYPVILPEILTKDDKLVTLSSAEPSHLERPNNHLDDNGFLLTRPIYSSQYSESSGEGAYNIRKSLAPNTLSVPNYSYISSTPNYEDMHSKKVPGHYITNAPATIHHSSTQPVLNFHLDGKHTGLQNSNKNSHVVEEITQNIPPQTAHMSSQSPYVSTPSINLEEHHIKHSTSPEFASVSGLSTAGMTLPTSSPSVIPSVASNSFFLGSTERGIFGNSFSVPQSAFENSHLGLPVFPPHSTFYSLYPPVRLIPDSNPTKLPELPATIDPMLITGSSSSATTDQDDRNSLTVSSVGPKITSHQASSVDIPTSHTTSLSTQPQEVTSTKTNTVDNVYGVFPNLNTISISPSIEAYTESTTVGPSTNTIHSSSNSNFKSTLTENLNSSHTSPLSQNNFKSTTPNSFASVSDNDITLPHTTENTFSSLGGDINSAKNVLPVSGFSSPKPFLVNNLQQMYVAPQLHSTILPGYTQIGRQLFSPQDLFRINNLHNPTEPSTPLQFVPEIVRSISFTLDTPEGLEQFERARSKGLFDR